MARKPRRPDPIHIGDHPRYTVRPMEDWTEEGWRWRLEWYVSVANEDGTRESKLRTLPLGRHADSIEAQKAALGAIASGKTGMVAAVRPGQVRTLDTLLRAFLASVQSDPDYAKGTKLAYASHVARLCGRIGDIPTDPPPEWDTLDRYRRGVSADGYKPGTVRYDLALLAAAWVWGRDRKLVHGTLPKVTVDVPEAETYTPSPAEIRRMAARLELWRAEGRPREKDKRIIYAPSWVPIVARILWATGARRTEVAALQRGDLRLELDRDPEEGPPAELRLGRHEGAQKTGGRWVPIDDLDTAHALADWVAGRGDGDPGDGLWGRAVRSVEEVGDWMRRACKAESLPHFTPQGIRRAVTDALFENGADPKVEAALLGHTDMTAMKHYRKPRASSLTAAVRRAGLGKLTPPAGDVLPFKKRGDEG